MQFGCPHCGAPPIALQAATPAAFDVAPLEAIEFLRQKLNIPTQRWTDLWQGMHARAFVIAGAQSEQLLTDFHEAINRAISEGRTLADFRSDFDAIVARYGWSYHGSRNWRSQIIFQTNLRMAYAAGRWAQIQRVKSARPYLRYVHLDPQPHPRPQHQAWHNLVLPVDHPWWDKHYPPNGWYCHCSVQSLSERDVEHLGLTVAREAPPTVMVDRVINGANGPVTIKVPDGIDPGFDYNVGAAGFGRGSELVAIARADDKFETLIAPGAPEPLLPTLPLDRVPVAVIIGAGEHASENELRAALRAALGGDEAIITDPLGGRVRLTQAIVDHMLDDPAERIDGRQNYFPVMPYLIRDPAEIWVGFVQNKITGQVEMRRRYVKVIQLDGGLLLGLVADAKGGEWINLTFYRSTHGLLGRRLRSGLNIFRR